MNKTRKTNQTGRSMVEMLGVLAIIGVLSVGGVYGYGVAMKKHKANELLHRASMLASTVSAQIMSGKDPTTLDTFANSNLGEFTLDYDQTKKTFDLKISQMDSSICNQLKAGGMVQKVECDPATGNATLTFYKNLATTPEQGEAFTGTDDNSGAKQCSADTDCVEGCQKCSGGKCINMCEAGQYCGGTQSDDETDSKYTCLNMPRCTDNDDCELTGCCSNEGICVIPDCGNGAVWVAASGSCLDSNLDPIESAGSCSGNFKGCTNNSDCPKNEFCAIDGMGGNEINAGTCLPIGNIHTVNIPEGEKGSQYNGFTYNLSDTLTWWSADNLCKALKKHSASLSELGCGAIVNEEGEEYWDCPDWDAWFAAFGGYAYWLGDSYNPAENFMYDGSQITMHERLMPARALCK